MAGAPPPPDPMAAVLHMLQTIQVELEARRERFTNLEVQVMNGGPRANNHNKRRSIEQPDPKPPDPTRHKPQGTHYIPHEASYFTGTRNHEEYLAWEARMENLFAWHNYSKAEKLIIAASYLREHARDWWFKEALERGQIDYPQISSWEVMKLHLRRRYVPSKEQSYGASLESHDKTEQCKSSKTANMVGTICYGGKQQVHYARTCPFRKQTSLIQPKGKESKELGGKLELNSGTSSACLIHLYLSKEVEIGIGTTKKELIPESSPILDMEGNLAPKAETVLTQTKVSNHLHQSVFSDSNAVMIHLSSAKDVEKGSGLEEKRFTTTVEAQHVTEGKRVKEKPPDYIRIPTTVATKEPELTESSAQISPLLITVYNDSSAMILNLLSLEEPKGTLVSLGTHKNLFASFERHVHIKLGELAQIDTYLSVLNHPMTAISHLSFAKSVKYIAGTETEQPRRGVTASWMIKEEPPDPSTQRQPMYTHLQANKGRIAKRFGPGDRVWLHMMPERFPNQRISKLSPRGDGPFKVLERINDNAYKIDLPGKFQVSNTFNVTDLASFDAGPTVLRSKPSQEGGNDEDIPIEPDIGATEPNQEEEEPDQAVIKVPFVPNKPVTRAAARSLHQMFNGVLRRNMEQLEYLEHTRESVGQILKPLARKPPDKGYTAIPAFKNHQDVTKSSGHLLYLKVHSLRHILSEDEGS